MHSEPTVPLGDPGSEPAAWDWNALDDVVRPRLVGVAVRRFGFRQDEAEDLVQDVFEQVWARKPRVRNPEAYLRTSLFHHCIDRRARNRNRPESMACPLGDDLAGDERPDRILRVIAVKGAFRRLSPECRGLLRDYVVEDEPLAVLADHHGISVNAVWKRIDRCLKRLLYWLT